MNTRYPKEASLAKQRRDVKRTVKALKTLGFVENRGYLVFNPDEGNSSVHIRIPNFDREHPSWWINIAKKDEIPGESGAVSFLPKFFTPAAVLAAALQTVNHRGYCAGLEEIKTKASKKLREIQDVLKRT